MNEWLLLTCFIALVLVAIPLIIYPLRKSMRLSIAFLPLLIIALGLSYWQWGAWSAWQGYNRQLVQQEQIQAVLQTVKAPEDLVKRLKARLEQDPQSARGWYLLGRLYASQNKWTLARDAFAKACQLNPKDVIATVNYGQSLWQLNQQQFDEPIRAIFKSLLEENPRQPDALAMLAMDAFMSKQYQRAIDYWQELLKLAPEQSEEAQMLRKAIAKAQQLLVKR